jgi:hypothetical protein
MEDHIILCRNCNNETVQDIISTVDSKGIWYSSVKPEETEEFDEHYVLTKCRTCKRISLYFAINDINDVSEWSLCFPNFREFTDDVPQRVLKIYNEALRVELVSQTAYSILTRKVIELLCKDKGAKGKDLKSKLKSLVDRNIIPKPIYEMADSIRIIGNIGAHDEEVKLNMFEIQTIKDFIMALLEYVYVAPSKIKKLKESIERKGKQNE